MAKESLFNILRAKVDFEEIAVLDLFAGTGNISFEFASRGAKEVLSVEQNHKCCEYIQKTAQLLNFNQLSVLRGNVFIFLKTFRKKMDVIFADPPYEMKEVALLPDLIFGNDLLTEEGWLVIEHDIFITFEGHPNFVEERKYGKVHFSLFAKSV